MADEFADIELQDSRLLLWFPLPYRVLSLVIAGAQGEILARPDPHRDARAIFRMVSGTMGIFVVDRVVPDRQDIEHLIGLVSSAVGHHESPTD